MSLLEQQKFLAQLFTNESLRHSFWENPHKIGVENDLNDEEIKQIKKIIEKDFNFFADSLYFKRLQDVEKLLPIVQKILGKQKFQQDFRMFSNSFLPKTVKKHLEDAIQFCKFLQLKNLLNEWQKEIVKFESAKLQFFGYQKRFVFLILHYDLSKTVENLAFEPEKKLGFAIWFRIGKTIKHYNF